jgi:hypothetical protein
VQAFKARLAAMAADGEGVSFDELAAALDAS